MAYIDPETGEKITHPRTNYRRLRDKPMRVSRRGLSFGRQRPNAVRKVEKYSDEWYVPGSHLRRDTKALELEKKLPGVLEDPFGVFADIIADEITKSSDGSAA